MSEKEIKQTLCAMLEEIRDAIESGSTLSLQDRIDVLKQDVRTIEEGENKFRQNYSADNIRWLREETGLGMLECKKALYHAKGDIDTALSYLHWTF